MRSLPLMLLAAPTLVLACAAPTTPAAIDTADPNTLEWVTPRLVGDPGVAAAGDATVVRAGDPFDLGVATQASDATVVHFVVDGTEVGACDAQAPGADCRVGDEWLWTFNVATPGPHVLEVWFVRADGSTTRLRRAIDVLPAGDPVAAPAPGPRGEPDPIGDDALVLDGVSEFNDAPGASPTRDDDIDPEIPANDPDVVADGPGAPPDTDVPPDADDGPTTPGYLDPSRASHAVFGGLAWSVQGHRVVFANRTLDGDDIAIGNCVRMYGTSINRYADRYGVSRAAIVAAAVAATGCDVDAPRAAHGLMGVRASTCAALTATDPQPLDAATCAQRMHDAPDFAIEMGVRWLASSAQRRQHQSDPPRMAATYATGALAPSVANRWHLFAPSDATGQRDFVTSFVAAYNAYRSNEHIAAMMSTMLPSDGTPLIPPGDGTPTAVAPSSQLDADAALQFTDDQLASAANDSLEASALGMATHSPILLRYHGGRVLSDPIGVYVIWWGARWRDHAGRVTAIRSFINGLDGSPWWQINSTYSDSQRRRVHPSIHLAGEIHVDASPRAGQSWLRISASYPNRLVAHYVQHGWPLSDHNIYLVLTDDRTKMPGFGTSFCGWHTVEQVRGTRVVFGWIGDGSVARESCGGRIANVGYTGPRHDAVDTTISVIAHELAEAATDPDVNAWYEGNYQEIGDRCAWNYGEETPLDAHHFTNVRLRGEDYLIQMLWSNARGGCVMHP